MNETMDTDLALQHPVIESASASTACQTNDSKLAYVITAAALGIISLLVGAVVLMVFAIASTGYSRALEYSDSAYTYLYEPEDNMDGWFEDQLDGDHPQDAPEGLYADTRMDA